MRTAGQRELLIGIDRDRHRSAERPDTIRSTHQVHSCEGLSGSMENVRNNEMGSGRLTRLAGVVGQSQQIHARLLDA